MKRIAWMLVLIPALLAGFAPPARAGSQELGLAQGRASGQDAGRGVQRGVPRPAPGREAPPSPKGAGATGGWRPLDRRGGYQEPAFARGYTDGYARGLDDSRDRDRYDPVGHRDYRSGDRGYNREYGSRDAYRNNYRAGFRQGYDEGYRDGDRDNR